MGLLPRQAHVPHPRQARQCHRLRRTPTHRTRARRTRLQSQIHQHGSHPHFRQAQLTLRHPPRALSHPRVQHRNHRRRLHGCHSSPSVRLHQCSRLYGHRPDRKSGLPAQVPRHQLHPRPRPRTPQGRKPRCEASKHPGRSSATSPLHAVARRESSTSATPSP